MELTEKIKNTIRDVYDFPKQGIVFKDITPIMQNPELCKEIIDYLKEKYKNQNIQGVAGIESRGFLLGMPLAMALQVPFIMIRKKGKLPYKTISHKYSLEYGEAEVEMHVDAVTKNQRILIHDDLLATGGSALAAANLVLSQNAEIVGFNFLVDLSFLNGEKRLNHISKNIINLVTY